MAGWLDGPAVTAQSESRVPSVVLGKARSGAVLSLGAAGAADVARGIAASGQVPYRVGSITKTFTAAVVLGLVQDDALALDAPVSRYLGGTLFDEVPLRALLAHRGGVQREAPGDMWEAMQGPDARTLRQTLPRAELVDRPGSRWHYSNLGYALLGLVVEEVTGESCSALIDRRLLAPLGLAATVWARPDGAACGYRVDPYADVVHREPDMDHGPGRAGTSRGARRARPGRTPTANGGRRGRIRRGRAAPAGYRPGRAGPGTGRSRRDGRAPARRSPSRSR